MLNPQQQLAVKTTEGPVRIIAGAGTGKTHTLVSRTAYLIKEKNIKPEEILTLTFTNKAAHELNERLQKKKLPSVNAMTFHALAAKLLRKFWNPDFTIITAKEQEETLKEILDSDEQGNLKDILLELEKIRNSIQPSDNERLNEILNAYQTVLIEKNAIDFTGLLTTLLKFWKENPEEQIKCQNIYSYILVDEYQDVNAVQIKMIRILAENHQNICVVGDPDQTIYSWRGARANTMKQFEHLYPESTSIALIKNYRNPPAILKGAENLIAHNSERLKKLLQPVSDKAGKISFWESDSYYQQYEMLFHLLEKYFGSHSGMHMADTLDIGRDEDFYRLNDIALLYRTQSQGKMLAAELSKRGYPCQMSAPESFWERKEIIDFLEGIESLRQWTDIDDGQKFSRWISDKISNFIESQDFTKSRINCLNHLISYAMAFDHLPIQEALVQFLDETNTEQETDNLIQADKINLLTLHAAKGLEFPIVIIIGLEEGNIPHKKLMDDPYWLAEERRLMYVGMTRAAQELHIFKNKKKKGEILEPSRFLNEIGSENMVPGEMPKVKIRQIKKREIKKAQMKLF